MAIDAVITWVDGNDPWHQTKRAQAQKKLGISSSCESASETRFRSSGEIDYCLRSLIRFAPWLRRIYIVTDNQTPSIVNALQSTPDGQKIRVVDHHEIFSQYEQYLPTFNSLSIEAVLWRINDLSEQFIYLNDDCMILQPVFPEDFFRQGKVVLRGEWRRHSEKKWINRLLPHRLCRIDAHRLMQEKSARLAGYTHHFLSLAHAPMALHKRTLAQYFFHHPDQLLANLPYPFRDRRQFWPLSLAQHLEMKQDQVVMDNTLKSIYINPTCHKEKKINAKLKQASRVKASFLCLQSLDMASDSIRSQLFEWLNAQGLG